MRTALGSPDPDEDPIIPAGLSGTYQMRTRRSGAR
jgi:hypothetical protein